MKLSLRRYAAAAVLTMAAAVGVTAGSISPASAGSCTELLSVDGTTAKSSVPSMYYNSYTLNVTPTARLGASNCHVAFIRSTVYIYKADGTILAQKTGNGTDANGAKAFGTLSVTVPNGTSQIGVGVKTEIYNGSTWEARDKDGWGVYVPNTTFNSATGQNIVAGGCNSTQPPSVPRSYHEWCKLPF